MVLLGFVLPAEDSDSVCKGIKTKKGYAESANDPNSDVLALFIAPVS